MLPKENPPSLGAALPSVAEEGVGAGEMVEEGVGRAEVALAAAAAAFKPSGGSFTVCGIGRVTSGNDTSSSSGSSISEMRHLGSM
eukprot:7307759-Pyramimonas_sp.AAC.1